MILVTGAAGHLGNVLVRELIKIGNKVRALILPGEDRSALNGLNVECVEGNILHKESLDNAFSGVDEVYHLAGLISIIPGEEDMLRKVNVEGTRNVIEAAQKSRVQKLIYTSSIHALSRPPAGMTIDESLPFDINNPAGAYDRTKAEATLAVKAAVKDGLDSVIVCPTGVIGPYDYRGSEMGGMMLNWMLKKINFLIDGYFDFVDVRDVAQGHILAGKHGKRGETYILSGERIKLENMCNIVKEVRGVRSIIVRIPYWLAIFAANFTELYYRLTKTKPRFTRYSLETVVSNSLISSKKARYELGYRPRSIKETIKDTVDWWLENQSLIRSSLRI
jgi:dihydroflavonol-4-reductase